MINVNNTNSVELENVVVDGQLCLSASKRQPVWVVEIVGDVYKRQSLTSLTKVSLTA